MQALEFIKHKHKKYYGFINHSLIDNQGFNYSYYKHKYCDNFDIKESKARKLLINGLVLNYLNVLTREDINEFKNKFKKQSLKQQLFNDIANNLTNDKYLHLKEQNIKLCISLIKTLNINNNTLINIIELLTNKSLNAIDIILNYPNKQINNFFITFQELDSLFAISLMISTINIQQFKNDIISNIAISKNYQKELIIRYQYDKEINNNNYLIYYDSINNILLIDIDFSPFYCFINGNIDNIISDNIISDNIISNINNINNEFNTETKDYVINQIFNLCLIIVYRIIIRIGKLTNKHFEELQINNPLTYQSNNVIDLIYEIFKYLINQYINRLGISILKNCNINDRIITRDNLITNLAIKNSPSSKSYFDIKHKILTNQSLSDNEINNYLQLKPFHKQLYYYQQDNIFTYNITFNTLFNKFINDYHNNELVIKYIKIELISLMNQRFKQIKIKYKGLTFKMYPSLEEIIKNNIKNNSGFDVICY